VDTSRLETFSDGVFAIAITLLVLGIEVPPPGTALGPELLRLWPSYVAYAVSFLVIGAIWINHHATFRHIVRVDGTLLVLNLFQLMVFAFLPFPTAVLAAAFLRGTDEGIAAAFYGATLAVGGILVNVVWQYATRCRWLLSGNLTEGEARQIGRRYVVGPLVYAVTAVIGLVLPWLALLVYAAVNVFYLWPRGVDEVALAPGADCLSSTDLGDGDGGAPRVPPG
jgi:TMEM175 potassium channel family protein